MKSIKAEIVCVRGVYILYYSDKIMADSRLIQSENSGYASDEHGNNIISLNLFLLYLCLSIF